MPHIRFPCCWCIKGHEWNPMNYHFFLAIESKIWIRWKSQTIPSSLPGLCVIQAHQPEAIKTSRITVISTVLSSSPWVLAHRRNDTVNVMMMMIVMSLLLLLWIWRTSQYQWENKRHYVSSHGGFILPYKGKSHYVTFSGQKKFRRRAIFMFLDAVA